MGAWTTGVVVVTAGLADGRSAGLVMVSLAPVSQEPPLVLWSVDRNSGSLDVWLGARGFALHLLAADQEALVWRFAAGEGKFDGLAVRTGVVEAPLLDGAVATIECVAVTVPLGPMEVRSRRQRQTSRARASCSPPTGRR